MAGKVLRPIAGTTGDRLRQLRELRGRTVAWCADTFGVSQAIWERWEAGETSDFPLETAETICRRLRWSIDWLAGRERQ